MKAFLITIVCFVFVNYNSVYSQNLTEISSNITTTPNDIHCIITNKTTEADLTILKEELMQKGVKLTVLSLNRKSNGLIKSISIRVSSADGVVTFNSDNLKDRHSIVIERNKSTTIGISGGDLTKIKK